MRIACIRYETILGGRRPRGCPVGQSFEKLDNLRLSLVLVQPCNPSDISACCPCEANPYSLLCKCKKSRKIGICSHIIGVTHCMMAAEAPEKQKSVCNVKYMTKGISKRKDGKTRGARGRPRRAGHCLQKDSSDDEDEPRLALEW